MVYNLLYSVVPQVIIVTDPPTLPYPAATWIRLRCDVVTPLSVSYNWTGYCTSPGSNQTVFRYTNITNDGMFTLRLRSTPTACRDTVVCSAVDSVGNTAEALLQITNVTGTEHSLCKGHRLMKSVCCFNYAYNFPPCLSNITLKV